MTSREQTAGAAEAMRCVSEHATFVETLLDRPKYKSELADELDVSKSTIYNRFCRLERLGLSERTDRGYGLTAIGRLHARIYLDSFDQSRNVYAAEPVLRELPPNCLPPSWFLREADVVTARSDPAAPQRELSNRLRDAESLKCLSPVGCSHPLESIGEAVESGALTVECVVERGALDNSTETGGFHAATLERLDGASVYASDAPIPFGLSIVDGRRPDVAVVAYSDHNHVIGYIRNTSHDALGWANLMYRKYRTDAAKVDTSEHLLSN